MDSKKIYCCYCGKWIVYPLKYSIEHLIPRSKGGNNKNCNKQPCCTICNGWKGSKTLYQFKSMVEIYIKAGQGRPPYYHQKDLLIMVENIQMWIDFLESTGKVHFVREEMLSKKKFITKESNEPERIVFNDKTYLVNFHSH